MSLQVLEAVVGFLGRAAIAWISRCPAAPACPLVPPCYASNIPACPACPGAPAPLPARQLMGIAQGHLRNRGTIPMVLGAFFALPLIYLFPRQTLWWTLHRPHATRSEAVALCTAALEDVSNGVSGFFLEMSRDRKEVCPDEGADTGGFEPGGLRRLTVPLLVVSAELDGLAPPKIVEPAFHRAGSEYAAFVRLGDPDGDGPAPPFGHCDMISGDAALTYVLPLLAAWIEGANPEFVAPTLQRSPSAKRRFAG